jgi:preprotein translocase subunit SecE
VTETRDTAIPERGDKPEKKKAKKAKVKKAPIGARISLFLRQMVAELRKVIWPTRRELITYTTVVVFFVAVMMLLTGVLDVAFTKAVFQLFS